MGLFNSRGQANPTTDDDVAESELKAKVLHVVKILDANAKQIHRWFLKALLAFNLVLWSLALCGAFLKWVS